MEPVFKNKTSLAVFGRFKKLSLNKFFNPSTPSFWWWVTILGSVADGVWKAGVYILSSNLISFHNNTSIELEKVNNFRGGQ